jgi:hypothetical protein
MGPVEVVKIRVPINLEAYKKKESELAQVDVEIARKKRTIEPTLNEIRKLRKQAAVLTVDLEGNTEERPEKVRRQWDWKRNVVKVFRATDMKLLEERTITVAERKRTLDIEDDRFAGKRSGLPESDEITAPPAAPVAAAEDHAADEEDADADAILEDATTE